MRKRKPYPQPTRQEYNNEQKHNRHETREEEESET